MDINQMKANIENVVSEATLDVLLSFHHSTCRPTKTLQQAGKSKTRDPHFKIPPGGFVLRAFTSRKIPPISTGSEHANLGTRGDNIY